MRILLIDTAGVEGSVALADTDSSPAVVARETLPGRTSSERLVPAGRGVLEEGGWGVGGLGGGVGLMAVSGLALLAAAVGGAGTVYAVLDAGRGEFYFGEYLGRRCV